MDQWTLDQWTSGRWTVDQWSVGPVVSRTSGPVDSGPVVSGQWTSGQWTVDQWSVGPVVSRTPETEHDPGEGLRGVGLRGVGLRGVGHGGLAQKLPRNESHTELLMMCSVRPAVFSLSAVPDRRST